MSLTTIDLDDEALTEAMRVSGIRTKKEAVNTALREFAERHKRIEAYEYYAQLAQNWDYESWERLHKAEKDFGR
ncbi:type II toxin-antitoxin system VapB family antitoxin [Streptomyces sp. A3M-1-3]|uniref:type II toxin-antitoxin system VapB family antitoxin n=1 Tax=Streptomyces sp. A3M-1-3 TaxID=2962044 RepID=UPI0020B8EF86|nr:type II toxin-antitoxin system VapB family antitoxin [Streptomyces sp. A3M-1-3]MCP3822017.1 type II toxin-antitoxin system VapB family antitoxin [Streptomyces sp. A3M-1-3]